VSRQFAASANRRLEFEKMPSAVPLRAQRNAFIAAMRIGGKI
jgi:hypothetical protein